jgi:hypothetical protein
MFNLFNNDHITINRKDYDTILKLRYEEGLKHGFKDGYKSGYNTARKELPEKLELNIKYLIQMLEHVQCNISVVENELDSLMLDREIYNGEFVDIRIDTSKFIVKMSPMAYVMYGSKQTMDDIKGLIEKIKR